MTWMEGSILLGALACEVTIVVLCRDRRRWWLIVMVALLGGGGAWGVHDRQDAVSMARAHHRRHCAQQAQNLERIAEDVERERLTSLHDIGFTLRSTGAYHTASLFCAKSYHSCYEWLSSATFREGNPEEIAQPLRIVADALRSGRDCPRIDKPPPPHS